MPNKKPRIAQERNKEQSNGQPGGAKPAIGDGASMLDEELCKRTMVHQSLPESENGFGRFVKAVVKKFVP